MKKIQPVRSILLPTLMASASLLLWGCPKPVPPADFLEPGESLVDTAPAAAPEEPAPRAPVADNPCSPLRVQFDYDSAALSAVAQQAIADNAECIQRMGYGRVVVEGHCCELGSTEYNIALGQRRADAVRTYLSNLGVDPRVLKTISYGEEVPLDSGEGESHRSHNRRAEFACSM